MSKSICLFNHKGGVSKTTTAFNLGWSLAEAGKRVLMIDLDSQCNLTGLVMGYIAIDDDAMINFYNNRNNLTMQPIVRSLIDGHSVSRIVSSDGNLLRTQKENLFCLPGHLDVSDLDAQISVSLKIAQGVPATRNIPGNLPGVLKNIADNHNMDYVIYDLSPNVGGLNEVILMSSDYFIVPTSPDYYCLQAIGSLEKNIRKWKREICRFREDNDFTSDAYFIRNAPKFLGAIQQRYRPRNERPAVAFQRWIDIIEREINEKFVPSLSDIDCVISSDDLRDVLIGSELHPYDLAHVPDFNSLIAISQQVSKPVFALSDDDIAQIGNVGGITKENMIGNRDKFRGIFEALAQRVIALTA